MVVAYNKCKKPLHHMGKNMVFRRVWVLIKNYAFDESHDLYVSY